MHSAIAIDRDSTIVRCSLLACITNTPSMAGRMRTLRVINSVIVYVMMDDDDDDVVLFIQGWQIQCTDFQQNIGATVAELSCNLQHGPQW